MSSEMTGENFRLDEQNDPKLVNLARWVVRRASIAGSPEKTRKGVPEAENRPRRGHQGRPAAEWRLQTIVIERFTAISSHFGLIQGRPVVR